MKIIVCSCSNGANLFIFSCMLMTLSFSFNYNTNLAQSCVVYLHNLSMITAKGPVSKSYKEKWQLLCQLVMESLCTGISTKFEKKMSFGVPKYKIFQNLGHKFLVFLKILFSIKATRKCYLPGKMTKQGSCDCTHPKIYR